VIFTALALLYLVVCAAFGLAGGRHGPSTRLSVALAAAMVCLQLALILRT
jgi:hypothetical protein